MWIMVTKLRSRSKYYYTEALMSHFQCFSVTFFINIFHFFKVFTNRLSSCKTGDKMHVHQHSNFILNQTKAKLTKGLLGSGI